MKGKIKKRVIIVVLFLIVFSIYLFVSTRGQYLQVLGIGEEYVPVFQQNMKYKAIVMALNFVFLYISIYVTGIFIKKGLKSFFDDDKKEMPHLPNKSIALIMGAVACVFTSDMIVEKAILAINSAVFGIGDPVFGIDIAFYMFQKPFIELLMTYFIGVVVGLSIYTVAYYILAFNRFFDEGVDIGILKKNAFAKQMITNVMAIAVAMFLLTILNSQDVIFQKLLTLDNGTVLRGAGVLDVTIRLWGERMLAAVILGCAITAVKNIKEGKFKKVMISIAIVPAYLVVIFLFLVGADLLYTRNNELDKQKKYIEYNIEYTKNAYNINIEEIEVENMGTITSEEIEENEYLLKNIKLIKEETILMTLKQYQTNLGYYVFNNTKLGMYNINGEDALIYVTPREIISNYTRTYSSKTYEYTHGFGVILNSASNVTEAGISKYLQKNFDMKDNKKEISEPRIYFGIQTNDAIITNIKEKPEYDYPLTGKKHTETTYEGTAGLKLKFLDRLILGINEGNLLFAFSGDVTDESNIITKRNVIERAKTVMPYLEYDKNPYMVITDGGRLVWVLDAYTMSNDYPYSQETMVELSNGSKQRISYIRNSVKVLIDSYDGTIEFYITDRTDPIAMAYRNLYPTLFVNLDKEIPVDISSHIVYSEYLYKVQAEVIKQYHDIGFDVLYRGDDVWDIAKESRKKVTSTTGTDIKPYYTIVKTVDNEEPVLGLVIPYTEMSKQNLAAYLVGTYDSENKEKLTLYRFSSNEAVLGTVQLDTLIEQDDRISKEIETLNTTGTSIEKNIIVIPINNTLLYVEPIYQVMLNESQVPILKKVVVASGNKVAIGNNLEEALLNLLSQEAVSIEVDSENINDLIRQIINANKNLEKSNNSNDWEMIGKDIERLQTLITKLEKLLENKENAKIYISD